MIRRTLRGSRLAASLVLAGMVLLSCGEGDAGQASTSKRLPEGGPCDLITAQEAATVFGVAAVEVEATDQIQCDYSADGNFAGANVIRGQDMSKATTGESVDLGVVAAERINVGQGESSCGVAVELANDPAQRFAVAVNGVSGDSAKSACEIADGIASTILAKLPE